MKPLLTFLFTAIFFFCLASESNADIVIKSFPAGLYNSNCHIVSAGNTGFIVDAGSNDTAITNYITKSNLKIKFIFCTHSHIDHVLFAPDLKKLTNAEIVLHIEDKNHYQYYTPERINEWLADGTLSKENLPYIDKFISIKYDRLIKGTEIFDLPGMKIELICTPGHSSGSVCILLNGKYLFTGDTIFEDNIGNSDIDSGNSRDIMESVRKLFLLDDNIIVYQGHGSTTTLKVLKDKIRL